MESLIYEIILYIVKKRISTKDKEKKIYILQHPFI